jgi:hypothetical protein
LTSDDDYSAILPTKLVTKAKQIFMGTTWSVDNFWYAWTTKPDEYGFAYSWMTSEDAKWPTGPISPKDLADLKHELSECRYDQECMLIPLSSEQRFFPPSLIAAKFTNEKYLEEFLEGSVMYVGVDPAASSRDESIAYPILQQPGGCVEDLPVLAWHNTPAPVQVQALKLFVEGYAAFNPLLIVDNTSAFGITFSDLLKAAGVWFLPFTFSSQSKALLFTKGKTMLEDLTVSLHDQETKHQLGVYQFRESEQVRGRFRFGEKNVPDDRVDALMLALWGLREPERYHGHATLLHNYP